MEFIRALAICYCVANKGFTVQRRTEVCPYRDCVVEIGPRCPGVTEDKQGDVLTRTNFVLVDTLFSVRLTRAVFHLKIK